MLRTGAIFDLDGTLLNSLQDVADCMNRALGRNGLPVHPVEAYRTFIGNGVRVLAQRVLPESRRHDQVLVERLLGEMHAEYASHWADTSRPYPGIAEMLDGLAARGVRMAILSNKQDRFTRLIAERFFSAWPFDPVIGSGEGRPHKPDPEAALQIARSWRMPAPRVLYAGDSDADMLTGSAAGMYTVGVLWGFRTREELERTGAAVTVQRPADVISCLTG
jgi:phosphoglycolate phosphatase